MKAPSIRSCAAIAALGLVLSPGAFAQAPANGEDPSSSTTVLLGRARTLEGRGRLDLARQNWLEVLSVSPGNAEALAGMVRAAQAAGHGEEARQYLDRLRSTHPNDPELARLGATSAASVATRTPAPSPGDQAEAARLANNGNAPAAMAIYRRLYGEAPPPGPPALLYYETEAAVPEGRPHAIAGLRALNDRYPTDARYAVALGKLLLASPRTRAEGRTVLERYPGDSAAVAALRNNADPADRPLASASPTKPLALPTSTAPAARADHAEASPSPPTRVRTVAVAATAGKRGALAEEEQAGFAALNQHRNADAEGIFQGILTRDPGDARALAGLGYLRSTSGDLKGAVRYFEQAQESGDRSLALTRALVNAQFAYALQGADAAVARGDLPEAATRYQSALQERPSDPEALNGLGEVLLRQGQLAQAIPVYTRLTGVRPLSPAAWRGLVLAETGAGRPAEALAADAHVPPEVRPPLVADVGYQKALATARNQQPSLLARDQVPASPSAAVRSSSTASATVLKTPASGALGSAAPASTPRAGSAPPPAAPAIAKNTTPAFPAGPPSSPEVPAVIAAAPVPTAPKRTGSRHRPTSNLAAATPTPPPPVPPPAVAVAPPPAPSPAVAIATERTTQGETALRQGNYSRAADLFRDAVVHQPERSEAWKGLITALHNSGQDSEALTALGAVPAEATAPLLADATLQGTAGAVYLRTSRSGEALASWERAQAIFATQHLQPPLELVMDVARLLASRGDDVNLYRQLMYVGTRRDLGDAQRREVQMIWTRWAVRRARVLALAGEQPRAVVVLNAAAEAFAGNQDVLSAVADGYAGIGLPREAVALYKAQDPARATDAVLATEIRAAIAARDFHAADAWVRVGKDRFPKDPVLLTAAAEVQQARGHTDRAADLTREARAVATPQDPGQVLTAELRESPGSPGLPGAGRLSVLLLPEETAGRTEAAQGSRPFLPSDSSSGNSVQAPLLAEGSGTSR